MNFRLKELSKDGEWSSGFFSATDVREVRMHVRAGFINGCERWAEDENGETIFRLDAKGKEVPSPCQQEMMR